MVRLSTAQIFQNGIDQILARQAQVQATELQLTSGRRVNVPSDDPVAAGQIVRLNAELSRIDQYQENASMAETQLSAEETVLGDVIDQLHRARELVVQANSSALTSEDRQSIGVEMNQLIEQVYATANSKAPNGDYLFSGFQTDVRPFIRTSGGASYMGDSGTRSIEIGAQSSIKTLDSGDAVFMRIPSGNGYFTYEVDSANQGTARIESASGSSTYIADDYEIHFIQLLPDDPITYEVFDGAGLSVTTGNYVSGEDIEFNGSQIEVVGDPVDGDVLHTNPSQKADLFGQLDQIHAAMNNASESPTEYAHFATEMSLGLENIDRALGHLNSVRTDIGSRMARIEMQQNLNEDFSLRVETSVSNLEDLDITEAISQLNLELTTLEAAQKAYVSVQGLSLFNYI